MKPTVLIHGYAFDHRIWYPVELAFEGRHVIYLSLPGFGLESVSTPYTIAELANKYWRHLNDILDEPVHLVGHSMGGYVCIEMVAQQPSKVASLALIHSHVFEDSAEKKATRTATMKDISEKGKDEFATNLISSLFANKEESDGIIKMLTRRGLVYDDNAWCFGVQAMRDRKDHATTLKNINIPVLAIMGEKDKAVPAELAQKQASLSDRIEMHMYPSSGHMAMYEQPGKMIQDLVAFYETMPA